jgi:RNA polymerase sigma-70 factor (family 1)
LENLENNEKILIKAFKNGDIKAFEALFAKYHKRLYLYIFNMLQSKEDTEEIVQDAFVKIWERREQYIDDYPFSSFLFKIAKNSFLNFIRKKVNKSVVDEHFDWIMEHSESPTDEYLIYRETKLIVDKIIESLPPKRREIFKLRRIDGLSRTEIAKSLGISIITVDSQLMKANKYVKDELKKHNLL